jgi:hypothetical protein
MSQKITLNSPFNQYLFNAQSLSSEFLPGKKGPENRGTACGYWATGL